MATYLITQATGQQGLWTIKHLLAAGDKVHAVVRDQSKIPDALKQPGVTVFQGMSENYDDIFAAAQGCSGVYLNTYAWPPGAEIRQAQTIVSASRAAGVKSVVACTAISTGDRDAWENDFTRECGLYGYYTSKADVEATVRDGGFEAWTILRPGFLLIDYALPHSLGNFPRLSTHGELDHLYDSGARMPHTDVSDVGRYAAAALRQPSVFASQAIQLASANPTVDEIADILVRVTGRNVVPRRLAPDEALELAPGQRFHLWANRGDFTSILAESEAAQARFGIPLTSVEDALRRNKDKLLESIPDKV